MSLLRHVEQIHSVLRTGNISFAKRVCASGAFCGRRGGLELLATDETEFIFDETVIKFSQDCCRGEESREDQVEAHFVFC